MNILDLKQFTVKRANSNSAQVKPDTSGLEAILDYAILEGAQMRLPLFVCMLRLARLALKEETGELQERQPEENS